jgi:hypothetical protein
MEIQIAKPSPTLLRVRAREGSLGIRLGARNTVLGLDPAGQAHTDLVNLSRGDRIIGVMDGSQCRFCGKRNVRELLPQPLTNGGLYTLIVMRYNRDRNLLIGLPTSLGLATASTTFEVAMNDEVSQWPCPRLNPCVGAGTKRQVVVMPRPAAAWQLVN